MVDRRETRVVARVDREEGVVGNATGDFDREFPGTDPIGVALEVDIGGLARLPDSLADPITTFRIGGNAVHDRVEGRRRVAHDPDRGIDVVAPRAGVEIDLDHVGVGVQFAISGGLPGESRPDREDDVGVPQEGVARRRQERPRDAGYQRVRVREQSRPEQRRGDRRADPLSETLHDVRRTRDHCAATDENRWGGRVFEKPERFGHSLVVGGHALGRPVDRIVGSVGGRGLLAVRRERDDDGTATGSGGVERPREGSREVVDGFDPHRRLGNGCGEGPVIQVLERSFGVRAAGVADEHDQRNVVAVGGGDAGRRVRGTRAVGDGTDADVARLPGVAVGHRDRDGLVARPGVFDPVIVRPIDQVGVALADEPEQAGDPFAVERRQDVIAARRRRVRLVGHRLAIAVGYPNCSPRDGSGFIRPSGNLQIYVSHRIGNPPLIEIPF